MRFLKWVMLSVVTLLLVVWIFIRVIASGINETIVYTEHDFLRYHSLTDKEIENTPRITKNYYFVLHPGDGYSPSNTIFFKGVTSIESLENYLKKLGYIRERRNMGEKAIWSKPGQPNGDIFYLYLNRTTGEAELTKVINN